MILSSKLSLSPGTLITGRFKGSRYVIQRLLGQGANGVVYLVNKVDSGKQYALKMGFDNIDIQSEINNLKALHKQGKGPATAVTRSAESLPYLLEVDDYIAQEGTTPFYVMRYIKGDALRAFLVHRGPKWMRVAGYSLLRKLQQLHAAGWVFGDLKPENIIVSPYGEVELIDYGGVSAIGRSVKQYTEWYDRGFWNSGSRVAESSYDWFSFAVITLHMLAEPSLKKMAEQLPQTRSTADLISIIDSESELQPYKTWLVKALHGDFKSTNEACQLWKDQILLTSVKTRRKERNTPRWMLGAFVASLVFLLGAVYVSLSF
ncbi:serine/threonine-protein kinase [Paenibacillus turicensis]|uniref:Serine/threonine-protein kinase n=1 Tax=Paenibacillus turicensis TaxID=160487 RepID=A0ABS4FXS4_9BACL|nr:serine/threonine-protein kinase [Paenibacillus turicensis]